LGVLDEYIKDGYWEIVVAPAFVKKDRIPLEKMKSLTTKSQARHRGWPFPMISGEHVKMHSDYMECIIISDTVQRYEGFRLYENGLFYWKGCMWENFSREYQKVYFSHVTLNWQITEMMLFLKRLYEDILGPDEIIDIQIRIVGCKGRSFYDDAFEYLLPPDLYTGKCDENDIILQKSVNYATLTASWKNMACDFINRTFAIFNANKIDNNFTQEMQNKLLKMKMI
jgi:hypothetical protein